MRYFPIIITLAILLTACGSYRGGETLSVNTNNTSNEEPDTGSIAPIEKVEDESIRAIAEDREGRLIIRPRSHAIKEPLGAPSCWGLETDLRWTGDYEAVWETADGESSNPLMTFPDAFEIIQPTDEAVNLQMVTIGDASLYTYFPRYTDCHALDLYMFGVKDGQAFPVMLEVEEGKRLTSFVQHPHFPLQVSGEELVITGGQGAGQDFINVYHFIYDPVQHALLLRQTDKVTPEDLMKRTVDTSTDSQ